MYCNKLFTSLDKLLEQKKSLEEIGKELCSSVRDPRDKATRLVKAHKGQKWLHENAVWLGYSISHIRNPNGFSKRSHDTEKTDDKFYTVTEDGIVDYQISGFCPICGEKATIWCVEPDYETIKAIVCESNRKHQIGKETKKSYLR